MSRGPGRVQRAILEYLAEHGDASLLTIAAATEGAEVAELPERVMSSYRRALRSLLEAGKVSPGWSCEEHRLPLTWRDKNYGFIEVRTRRKYARKYELTVASGDNCSETQHLDELAEREARIARAMGGRP